MATVTMCGIRTTRGGTCSRPATFVVDTLVDGHLAHRFCCAQHKPRAIEELVDTDPYHDLHFVTTLRLCSQIVNTHVRVIRLADSSVVECVSQGFVEFGPMTEREYLDHLYEMYQDEYCRIGMFGLHEDDRYYRDRYDQLARQMRAIEDRL